MTKRGRILRDANMGPGLLTTEGVQYTFVLEGMWRSDVPPRAGMPVDVQFDGAGVPQSVYAVSESQVAKEQAEQALAGARLKGSALTQRIGATTLVVEAVMLLAFFLLPNLRISAGFGSRAMSGWDAASLDVNAMGASSVGLLNLLALVALFAPLAVVLLRAWWVRWLYAAPLAFVVVCSISFMVRIQSVENEAASAMGGVFGGAAARQMSHSMTGMFSPGVGAYVVLVCSLYLVSRVFKTAF